MTALALAGAAALWPMARQRLELSLAKHPSLTGHSRMAKRVAAWVPGYAYDEARFFGADAAPADVQRCRRAGFMRLAEQLSIRHAKSIALTQATRQHLPDLQFTGHDRVPYPFGPYLRQHLSLGSFVHSSEGVTLTDIDGVRFYDLTGSYGVNVMGNDFYKDCIREGSARVTDLGPVLGSYHPVVAWNVEALTRISGLPQVSFHMSGTEAVMQAVRLARYHTKRPYLVRFSGAYHGWWEDVQPGPGRQHAAGARHAHTALPAAEDGAALQARAVAALDEPPARRGAPGHRGPLGVVSAAGRQPAEAARGE